MGAFDRAIENIQDSFERSGYSDWVRISLIICGENPELRPFTTLRDFEPPSLAKLQEESGNYQNFLSPGLDQLKRCLKDDDKISEYKPILILVTNQPAKKSKLEMGMLPSLYLTGGGKIAELRVIVGEKNRDWGKGKLRDALDGNVCFAGAVGDAEAPETWLVLEKKK